MKKVFVLFFLLNPFLSKAQIGMDLGLISNASFFRMDKNQFKSSLYPELNVSPKMKAFAVGVNAKFHFKSRFVGDISIAKGRMNAVWDYTYAQVPLQEAKNIPDHIEYAAETIQIGFGGYANIINSESYSCYLGLNYRVDFPNETKEQITFQDGQKYVRNLLEMPKVMNTFQVKLGFKWHLSPHWALTEELGLGYSPEVFSSESYMGRPVPSLVSTINIGVHYLFNTQLHDSF